MLITGMFGFYHRKYLIYSLLNPSTYQFTSFRPLIQTEVNVDKILFYLKQWTEFPNIYKSSMQEKIMLCLYTSLLLRYGRNRFCSCVPWLNLEGIIGHNAIVWLLLALFTEYESLQFPAKLCSNDAINNEVDTTVKHI